MVSGLRNAFLTGVLAAIWLMPIAAFAEELDIVWQAIQWGELERTYGVYVPQTKADPAPLVLLLHGGGGRASGTWEQEHGRSWRALADEHGFVLLLPEGRPDPSDPNAHHWNDCRTEIESPAVATEEDDVGFVLHVIDTVSDAHAIDPSRIFATGASNGGMMTFRLALEAGDRFAAAAAVIANLPSPSECPGEAAPIPMLIMNGTDDPIMPRGGGCVAGEPCERGRVLSTTDTIAFWVGLNGASGEPAVERLPNRSWFDGSTVTVYSFDGGDEGADVVYYRVSGGGHAVPGFGRPSLPRRIVGGDKNRDIDGPAEIWSFFERHVEPRLSEGSGS